MFWYARFLAQPEERAGATAFAKPGNHARLRFKRHPLPGGNHTALGDARATMRLLFEMSRGPHARVDTDPADRDDGPKTRNGDGLRRGYERTYTPERGGPFGRKITEPYTGGSHEMGNIVRSGPTFGLDKRFLCLPKRRMATELRDRRNRPSNS